MFHIFLRVIVVVLLLSPVSRADAQQARDAGADVRLQAMINELTSEKSALQAENSRLQSDLEAAEAEIAALAARNEAVTQELGAAEASRARAEQAGEQTTSRLEQTEARLEELVERFRETIDTLASMEVQNAQCSGALTERNREYSQCAASNRAMYSTSLEVLDAYEDKGFFDRLGQQEPFFRLRRNQIENLADEYRYELEDSVLPSAE